MFSDHNRFKLEINNQVSTKQPNIWKLNKIYLNNPYIKEKVFDGKLECISNQMINGNKMWEVQL